ncbi:hypothetical protein PCIT_a3040 [Pseudoalteromonas citrea]|uniref:Uncharacterized protein n=1 Tax=Pseudoalteromonas citrea TaxID=43655 RepID=A0AAD4AI78_9GAMM|nr:hypothetical protein PCIT_a3040 [Pseudoalteromonas citrea]
MSKSMKTHLITAGIATFIAAVVVYASNNIDAVEDVIG